LIIILQNSLRVVIKIMLQFHILGMFQYQYVLGTQHHYLHKIFIESNDPV